MIEQIKKVWKNTESARKWQVYVSWKSCTVRYKLSLAKALNVLIKVGCTFGKTLQGGVAGCQIKEMKEIVLGYLEQEMKINTPSKTPFKDPCQFLTFLTISNNLWKFQFFLDFVEFAEAVDQL